MPSIHHFLADHHWWSRRWSFISTKIMENHGNDGEIMEMMGKWWENDGKWWKMYRQVLTVTLLLKIANFKWRFFRLRKHCNGEVLLSEVITYPLEKWGLPLTILEPVESAKRPQMSLQIILRPGKWWVPRCFSFPRTSLAFRRAFLVKPHHPQLGYRLLCLGHLLLKACSVPSFEQVKAPSCGTVHPAKMLQDTLWTKETEQKSTGRCDQHLQQQIQISWWW